MKTNGLTEQPLAIMCPRCGGCKTIPIVAGFPNAEAYELAEQRKIRLGGCIVGPDTMNRYCTACDIEFLQAFA